MIRSLFVTAFASGVLISGTAACIDNTSSPENTLADRPSSEQPLADNQTAQVNLQTYDETASGIPVRAQYPDTMEVFGTGSGEGVGVFFNFKPQNNALDDAQVHIFLPAGANTVSDYESFVTGPNGLIESNSWIVNNETEDSSEQFSYIWVDKVINFSTDMEQSGHVLLGQFEEQVVQVILLYPSEMATSYWPDASIVLDSLEFDSNLLPIEAPQALGHCHGIENPCTG